MAEAFSTEELGRIETACGVLDNEAERLLNIRNARDEVGKVAERVRALLADARTIHETVARAHAEVTTLEGRKEALATQMAQDTQRREQQREAWRQEAVEHERAMTQRKREVAGLEEQYQAKQAVLEEHFAAQRSQLEAQHAESQRQYQEQLAQMGAELEAVETQVRQAQQLRARLTALHG